MYVLITSRHIWRQPQVKVSSDRLGINCSCDESVTLVIESALYEQWRTSHSSWGSQDYKSGVLSIPFNGPSV